MSSDRRDLYNGFGDTYSRTFEIVVTPTIFGLLGWFVDTRFDTFPVFALTFGLLVFAYEMWKLSRFYLERSAEEDRKILGNRSDA
jgi:hypothetical protein